VGSIKFYTSPCSIEENDAAERKFEFDRPAVHT